MSETWAILGATSSMAKAFVKRLASKGDGVLLCGRDMDDLNITASDALSRGARLAESWPIDMRDTSTFAPIIERLAKEEGMLNVAVFTGSMPDQSDIDDDPTLIAGVMQDNHTGPAEFLHAFAKVARPKGGGQIIGVGSVAGDRGRLGNFVYGSSKAAFDAYLSGLRNQLGRDGIHVLTVKPGMIDTSMTWGMDKLMFPGTPESVANDILKGSEKKRNIVYTPWIWRYVMFVISHVPEFIFKKLSI